MAKANRVPSTPRRTASKTGTRRSEISKVKMSGLELVKVGKGKTANLATAPDFAKLDFKPWTRAPGDELFPSDKLISAHGTVCRYAYAIMLRTREQLIAMHRWSTTSMSMMANLLDTKRAPEGTRSDGSGRLRAGAGIGSCGARPWSEVQGGRRQAKPEGGAIVTIWTISTAIACPNSFAKSWPGLSKSALPAAGFCDPPNDERKADPNGCSESRASCRRAC